MALLTFRSIQHKITVLTGLCLLVTAVGLIAYARHSSTSVQQLVSEKSTSLLQEHAIAALAQRGSSETAGIERVFNHGMTIASSLAQSLSLINRSDSDYGSFSLSRDQVNFLLKNAVIANPELESVYTAWEPDALDGRDSEFLNGGDVSSGNDADGRFVPYWWMEDGKPQMEALVEHTSTKLMPSGEREGEYYFCPKETGANCLVEPAEFEVDKEQVLLSSVNAPIMREGIFVGMVGVDVALDFLQDLATEINDSLYGGAGEVAIVSNSGILAGYSRDGTLKNQPLKRIMASGWERHLQNIQQGRAIDWIDDGEDGQLTLLTPIEVAGVNRPWALMIRVPLKVVMAEVTALDSALTELRNSSVLWLTLGGALITALALLFIWGVARGIVRPLVAMLDVLKDIAEGEGDLTKRLHDNARDETGQLAHWVNIFLQKLQGLIGEVMSSAVQVRNASQENLEVSHQTGDGVLRQQGEIDQVVAAVNEMAATSQESARNASQAAEAAANADRETAKGQGLVSETRSSIHKLAEEIASAGEVIQKLEGDSDAINDILVVIRGIAEQTNLLALNAAIEAARAGEQGRGFAVVADEVRTLASRTQESIDRINQMIENLQSGTARAVEAMNRSHEMADTSVEQVNQAADSLTAITTAVSVITDMNIQIATAAEEQSAVSEDVSRNITIIGRVADELAEAAKLSNQSSDKITGLADQLHDHMGHFKV